MTTPEQQKAKILIVDDTPANIQVLGSILSPVGYTVYVAKSGEDALTKAPKIIPDLILLDVMMPGIDGFETCVELKKHDDLKETPVIYLTACSESESIVKGFDCGGVDYISKPFNSAELLVRVKTHLALKFAREEIESLKGILPICARCKKIRDDSGFWENVESYIETHSSAKCSHGLCPECEIELYGDKDWWLKVEKNQEKLKKFKEQGGTTD